LGTDVPVTDREIEESLWHYYYDVEKTVNYLLSIAIRFFPAFGSCLCDQGQQVKATPKTGNKQTEASKPKLANGRSYFFSHAKSLCHERSFLEGRASLSLLVCRSHLHPSNWLLIHVLFRVYDVKSVI